MSPLHNDKTMMAVRFHEFGGPEVLIYEEVARPAPAGDEILIQVWAAAVNPLDWKIRAGVHPFAPRVTRPGILGWDVSGKIVEVGHEVTKFSVGDDVYARPGNYDGHGSYAQFQAVRAAEAAHKPQSLTHIEAASLPLVALTTWQSIIDAADLQAGQRILVHAAAGGCGTFAVQLAKTRGATVIGTASGRNRAFLEDLGVDQFVEYTAERFEDVVEPVDVIYDLVGGATQERSWQLLKPNGYLVSVVRPAPDPAVIAAHRARGSLVVMVPNGDQLRQVAELVDGGQIRPVVSTVLPLPEAAAAHRLIETGHTRGKIVLEVA